MATFLTTQGYDESTLYTFTWGHANAMLTAETFHSKEHVMDVRHFIEAVIEYTKKNVTVIGHSMGVTLARQALKGGSASDHLHGHYVIGDPLTKKVSTFIGLAGANIGLTNCYTTAEIPTCNAYDGFFPGTTAISSPSTFRHRINQDSTKEAGKVYAIWSQYDDLIMYGCEVWGKVTCRIPGMDGEVVKKTPGFGHFSVRDQTGPDMI